MPAFTAAHVRRAFAAIRKDAGATPGFGPSRRWDIVDDATGERFAPKAVLSRAKHLAGDDTYSGGGGDRGTNDALRSRGFRVLLKLEGENCAEAADIDAVIASGRDATTKQRLINARLGQGGFREELVELFEGRCVLTGLAVPEALRASHIKPWSRSDDAERLDPHNGLLLAATVDALFDKHLVTFAEDGRLLVSPKLTKADLAVVGLDADARLSLSPAGRAYMGDHRHEFERLHA